MQNMFGKNLIEFLTITNIDSCFVEKQHVMVNPVGRVDYGNVLQ
jgi:hypothetical protein